MWVPHKRAKRKMKGEEVSFSTNAHTLKHFLTPTIKYRNRIPQNGLLDVPQTPSLVCSSIRLKKDEQGFGICPLNKTGWLAWLARINRWSGGLMLWSKQKQGFGDCTFKQSSSIVTLIRVEKYERKMWVPPKCAKRKWAEWLWDFYICTYTQILFTPTKVLRLTKKGFGTNILHRMVWWMYHKHHPW